LTFPADFSQPETQVALQANVVQTIQRSPFPRRKAREIEARAAPEREKVRQMFEAYRRGLGNGEQHPSASVSLAVQEKFANYRPPSGNGG
jgi:hypothetical protein